MNLELAMNDGIHNGDYARVAAAIDYLRRHAEQQPGLEDVAAHVGVSPFHFQRIFQRWAGVSPKRFLQFLTVEHAKRLLDSDSSVLDTTHETGLSSGSRLHDLFVVAEAVTPGEYKSRGVGLEIRYGLTDSPFGRCLVAVTDRGIVALSFVDDDERAVAELRRSWSGAELRRDDAAAIAAAGQAFGPVATPGVPLRLLLKGTNFQLQVWRALLEIPFGAVATYGDIARTVCTSDAARAVGNAVAANAIAYLIPCHRVIRGDGTQGGYRWGTARKGSMLGWEQGRLAAGM